MYIKRRVQPLDTMSHVSIEQATENFEAVAKIVDKDHAGIIIDKPNGRSLVVCPYNWFAFLFDNDFGCIVNSALRYSINRKTYMPSVTVEFIRKHIKVLDTRTIEVAMRDIEVALNEGMVDDHVIWEMLMKELKSQLIELYKNNQRNESQ